MTPACSAPRRGTHLRSAPGEAHLSILAGLGSKCGEPRGHGVLRPSRRTEITDLETGKRGKM